MQKQDMNGHIILIVGHLSLVTFHVLLEKIYYFCDASTRIKTRENENVGEKKVGIRCINILYTIYYSFIFE